MDNKHPTIAAYYLLLLINTQVHDAVSLQSREKQQKLSLKSQLFEDALAVNQRHLDVESFLSRNESNVESYESQREGKATKDFFARRKRSQKNSAAVSDIDKEIEKAIKRLPGPEMMSWFTGLMYMIPATGMIVYAAIVELFTKPFSIYLIIKVIYGVVFWEIMSFVGFIITPCAMKDFKQKPGMTKFPKHPVS